MRIREGGEYRHFFLTCGGHEVFSTVIFTSGEASHLIFLPGHLRKDIFFLN